MRPPSGILTAPEPWPIQRRALDRGLLLLTCGNYGNVIRFLFPLTISDDVFDEALGIFEAAVHG